MDPHQHLPIWGLPTFATTPPLHPIESRMFATACKEIMRIRAHRIAPMMLVAVTLSVPRVTHASAIDDVRDFRIERGSLGHVLLEIARLAGRHIAMPSDVTGDLLAGPVMGVMSVPAAARQALSGTNLCNDPVKPAQVRRLKRTPQPEFSSSAPDGAVDGCRTESNQRSRGWHAAAFRSDDDARIAP